ncbi:hypothetical protein [Actinoplanes sp. G11-F43]|uniref:hypothetical protein n=1 Tax=Actinoplanes sp. G11-F43 TaxID=3424130 RepID=UPI003D327C09
MAFDPSAYKQAVLEPARKAGHTPPADLLVRYALDRSDLGSDSAFEKRVTEVSGYWNRLSAGNNQVYKKLVAALIAAHTELERRGELTAAAFRKQREQAETAARARLTQRVTSIAKTLSCVTLDTVRRLVEDGGGVVEEREVRDALRKQGIRVVDPPWRIPSGPPLPTARKLAELLTLLDIRLSVELILGTDGLRQGFTLKDGFRTHDGKVIGAETLAGARDGMATRALDKRKTAATNVITLLQLALETPGKLEELLIWEIATILRRETAAGLPVNAVIDTATDLGLDNAEAWELVVSLPTGTGDGEAAGPADDSELVEELIRAGDLHGAAELAGSPDTTVRAATRERLDAALAEVAGLLAEAGRANTAGDTEQEAILLGRVLAKKNDDDVRARLDRIAPPPPDGVTATADGDRVVVNWRHSPARTGTVRYRVVRAADIPAVSPDAHGGLGETDTTSAVDGQPLIGVPGCYTVFAGRGSAWSAGVPAPPVTILPEVGDLRLDATATSVSGSWTVSPEAIGVEIQRTGDDGEPRPVTPLPGGQDGFTDDGLRSGVLYEYRVRAVYRAPDGGRLTTPGVVASIRPQDDPVAVTDLMVEPVPNSNPPLVELTWTDPPAGVAEIRQASGEPAWAPGEPVSLESVRSYGRRQTGALTRRPGGRAAMRIPARDGAAHFTVFSVGPRHAVAGNRVRYAIANPVTDLRAQRLGTRIRLSWIWPDEASAVLVSWQGEDGRGERECLRREFVDDGGFSVDAGTGAVEIAVRTLARDDDGRVLSAPATRSLAARRPHVRYRFDRSGVLGRNTVLVLTSDTSCEVPPVTVVRGDRRSGEVIARIPGCRISPGTPVVRPVGSSRRVGPLPALACFPENDAGDGLVFGPM